MILVEGDNLVLKRGGQRVEAHYVPAVYHVLKSFAHIPLALDVILESRAARCPWMTRPISSTHQLAGGIVISKFPARRGSRAGADSPVLR